MSKISLRLVTEADSGFIEKVYFSTRIDEFVMLGWQPEQLEAFLKMQSDYQQRAYKMQFPAAENSLILHAENPVGRMIVDRTADYLLLVDIALLTEYRGNGIGAFLIRQLQEEAAEANKPLLLEVEKANIKAKKLYESLGFTINGETDLRIGMKWKKNNPNQ
jgi:ribosomal protein S18 acetylase RimI-like enzyme